MTDAPPAGAGMSNPGRPWTAMRDDELVEWVALADEDSASAKQALVVLHERYSTDVLKLAIKAAKTYPGKLHGYRDIEQRTWERIFERADGFPDPGKRLDDDAAKRWTRKWIANIVRSVASVRRVAWSRELTCIPDDDLPSRPIRFDLAADDVPGVSPERKRQAQAMAECIANVLSSRDQEIFRACWPYIDVDGRCDLPVEVRAKLCAEYGTTEANIRKIKERALKKVAECAKRKVDGMANGGTNE